MKTVNVKVATPAFERVAFRFAAPAATAAPRDAEAGDSLAGCLSHRDPAFLTAARRLAAALAAPADAPGAGADHADD